MNGLELVASIHINHDGAGTWRTYGIKQVIREGVGVYRVFLRQPIPDVETVEIVNIEQTAAQSTATVEGISDTEKRISIFQGAAPADVHVHVTLTRMRFDTGRGDAT